MTKQLVSVVTGRIPAGFDSKAVSITSKLSQIHSGIARGVLDDNASHLVKSSKICLDPDYSHLKRVIHSTRRCSTGAIVFHYYRFSEPSVERPTNIRFYDKDNCEFWSLPLTKLSEWIGTPTVYLFDSGDAASLVKEIADIDRTSIAFGCSSIVDPAACINPDNCPKGVFSNCIASPALTVIKSVSLRLGIPGHSHLSEPSISGFKDILFAIAEVIARNLWELEISTQLFEPDLAKITLAAVLTARISNGNFSSTIPVDWKEVASHPLWLVVDSLVEEFSASETNFQGSKVFQWAISAFKVDLQPYLLPLVILCIRNTDYRCECLSLLDKSSISLLCFHRAVATIAVQTRGLSSLERVYLTRLLCRMIGEDPGIATSLVQLCGRKLQSWLDSSDPELREISRSTITLLGKHVPSISTSAVPVSMQSMAKENGMLFQTFLGKEGSKDISRSVKSPSVKPHPVTRGSAVSKIFSSDNVLSRLSVSGDECVFWDERNFLFHLGSKSHRPRNLEISENQNLRTVKLHNDLVALNGERVNIYSVDRGMEIVTLPVHPQDVFFTDTSTLAAYSNGSLVFWDLSSSRETCAITTSADVLATCQVNRLACLGCSNGQLRLVDFNRLDKSHGIRAGSPVICMHSYDWTVAVGSAAGDFELWDLRMNQQLASGKFESCVSHFDVHASGVAVYDFQDELRLGFISRSGETLSNDFISADENVRAVGFIGENTLCLTNRSLYLIENS